MNDKNHNMKFYENFLSKVWTQAATVPSISNSPNLLSVPPPNRAYLRTLIHNSDLEHLEKVVLDGHGHRLMYESSTIGKVTKFLSSLPDLMVRVWIMLTTYRKNPKHMYYKYKSMRWLPKFKNVIRIKESPFHFFDQL